MHNEEYIVSAFYSIDEKTKTKEAWRSHYFKRDQAKIDKTLHLRDHGAYQVTLPYYYRGMLEILN